METYSARVACENCGTIDRISLPKGERIPEVTECRHCGCRSARKTWIQPKPYGYELFSGVN